MKIHNKKTQHLQNLIQGENYENDDIVQGDTLNTNDVENSEFEDVNLEIILKYDLNFPPMVKWTKDPPKSEFIGETSTRVLTHAQQKQKQ